VVGRQVGSDLETSVECRDGRGLEKSVHGTLVLDDVKQITLFTLLKLLYSELNACTEHQDMNAENIADLKFSYEAMRHPRFPIKYLSSLTHSCSLYSRSASYPNRSSRH
jgi:hypothetical protein